MRGQSVNSYTARHRFGDPLSRHRGLGEGIHSHSLQIRKGTAQQIEPPVRQLRDT